MVSNALSNFDKKIAENIQETIFRYFDKIAYKKNRDIEKVAQNLLANFKNCPCPTQQEFKAKIFAIKKDTSISPETMSSFEDCLESTFEIYEDPDSYLGLASSSDEGNTDTRSKKAMALQGLIIDKIVQLASRLNLMTSGDQSRFIREKTGDSQLGQKRAREFDEARASHAKKTRGIPSTTNLTDLQMDYKWHLFDDAFQNNLIAERDTSLEIYEDGKILFRLWKQNPNFFQDRAEILYLCPRNFDLSYLLNVDPSIWSRFVDLNNSALLYRCIAAIGLRKFLKYFSIPPLSQKFISYQLASDPLVLRNLTSAEQGNRGLVLIAVKKDGRAIEFASEQLRNDPEVVSCAITNNGRALKWANQRFKKSEQYVRLALETDGLALMHADKDLLKNKNLVAIACQQDEANLCFWGNELPLPIAEMRGDSLANYSRAFLVSNRAGGKKVWHSDTKLALDLYRENKKIFQDHSKIFFQDFRNVWLACRLGVDIRLWSHHIGNDENNLLAIVIEDPKIVDFYEFKDIKSTSLMIELIKIDCDLFKCAAEELLNVPHFILKAVSINGRVLQYANENHRNNREIVKAAATSYPAAVVFASSNLLNDKDFALFAFKRNSHLLEFMSDDICGDLTCVLAATKSDPRALRFASRAFLSDRRKLLLVVQSNPSILAHIKEEFRTDPEFIKSAINANVYNYNRVYSERNAEKDVHLVALAQNAAIFNCSPLAIQSNPKVLLKLAKGYKAIIRDASSSFLNDPATVFKAIELSKQILDSPLLKDPSYRDLKAKIAVICASAFEFANERLHNDRTFVSNAININHAYLQFASAQIRNDSSFVLSAATLNSKAFQYISQELRNDQNFLLNALAKCSGSILEFANETLRNDREFILAAIKVNIFALDFAGEVLHRDPEFILAVVQANRDALKFVSEEFRNNRDIVLAAVRYNGLALEFASENLRNDREILLVAVQNHSNALQYIGKDLSNDRELMLAQVQDYGGNLEYASEKLRDNREIVLAAVQDYAHALGFASENLRNDREIVLAAMGKKNEGRLANEVLEFAGKEFCSNHECMLAAVQKDGYALLCASDALCNNSEIVLAALASCDEDTGCISQLFECVGEQLRKDLCFMLAALKISTLAWDYADEALHDNPEFILAGSE